MSLTITERMAVGWFLTINQTERKRVTVKDVRCAHGGCVLACVVTIHKELYVLGVTDATRTEWHIKELREVLPTRRRLTAETVQAMTVDEFLAGFRSKPRGFSMRDLAEVDTGHRYGWLDRYASPSRARARCKHLAGYVPREALKLDTKSTRVDELDQLR